MSRDPAPRSSVRVAEDGDALARAAAEVVLEKARDALALRGWFHLALSGGSTPRGAYRELARRMPELDVARWHVWFVDERCVPPDHPDSNFEMVRATGLLEHVPALQVHRMRGEAPDPAAEAARYERDLCAVLGTPPCLDLVLLGLGRDGHVASLFPGTPALAQRSWVTVGRAPIPPTARLTLTYATLERARAIVFLVAGAEKRAALDAVLAGAASDLPAGRVQPREGTVLWLVERSAAGSRSGDT